MLSTLSLHWFQCHFSILVFRHVRLPPISQYSCTTSHIQPLKQYSNTSLSNFPNMLSSCWKYTKTKKVPKKNVQETFNKNSQKNSLKYDFLLIFWRFLLFAGFKGSETSVSKIDQRSKLQLETIWLSWFRGRRGGKN